VTDDDDDDDDDYDIARNLSITVKDRCTII
jgi:hypothetical protein